MNELELKILTLDLEAYIKYCEVIACKKDAYRYLCNEGEQIDGANQSHKLQLIKTLRMALYDEILQLQHKAWLEIGRQLGWNISRREFLLECLIGGRKPRKYDPSHTRWPSQLIDHAHWARKGVPKAIITNTYIPKAQIQAVAASIGLKALMLPVSAYFPDDRCTAAILIADPNNILNHSRLRN